MKNYIYIFLFSLVTLAACEENDSIPPYQVVGDSYATVVQFSVSDDEPSVGDEITFEVNYVNYPEDPIQSIELFTSVGGNRTSIGKLQGSGAAMNSQNIYEVNYTIPEVARGKEIETSVELYSKKEFPQVERLTVSAQENIPTIAIIDVINELPFGGTVFPLGDITYQLEINSDNNIIYRDLEELSYYYTIGSGAEILGGSKMLSGNRGTFDYKITIPEGSENQTVRLRFEVSSEKGDKAETSTPIDVGAPTPLVLSSGNILINSTDTLGYDLQNISSVATAGDDANKDVVIQGINNNKPVLTSFNETVFMTASEEVFQKATLNLIAHKYEEENAVESMEVSVGDVFIAKLRGIEEFVILKITGIDLKDGETIVEFDVKHL